MCGYFCIGFIDFMLASKTLTDYTSLFSPHDFNNNDQIILSYFKDAWNRTNKIIRSNKIQIVQNKTSWKLFYHEIMKLKTKNWLKELIEESGKESDKELIEIISSKNDESTTDWCDKNKFNKILTTIDSNDFNHKNKKGKLKFNIINNLVNNIKNNTISETHAKQKLNALNEIKKAEIKGKRLISGQKKL